jgi:hypothetical protein
MRVTAAPVRFQSRLGPVTWGDRCSSGTILDQLTAHGLRPPPAPRDGRAAREGAPVLALAADQRPWAACPTRPCWDCSTRSRRCCWRLSRSDGVFCYGKGDGALAESPPQARRSRDPTARRRSCLRQRCSPVVGAPGTTPTWQPALRMPSVHFILRRSWFFGEPTVYQTDAAGASAGHLRVTRPGGDCPRGPT